MEASTYNQRGVRCVSPIIRASLSMGKAKGFIILLKAAPSKFSSGSYAKLEMLMYLDTRMQIRKTLPRTFILTPFLG